MHIRLNMRLHFIDICWTFSLFLHIYPSAYAPAYASADKGNKPYNYSYVYTTNLVAVYIDGMWNEESTGFSE